MMADQAGATLPSDGREIDVVRAQTIELWKLSWPVVLSRLGIMTMGLSDAIVVGRYSATQLGYHALAWAPTSGLPSITTPPAPISAAGCRRAAIS